MKIACWSGPRNISTALMRAWSSREDTYVTDEPLYAYYLNETKLTHPMSNKIIEYYDYEFEKVVQKIQSSNPGSKKIWYQKHMAHHILNIKFSDKMLKWKKGNHPNDGIWWTHWYGNVIKTTGFTKLEKEDILIDAKYRSIYNEANDYYCELRKYCL